MHTFVTVPSSVLSSGALQIALAARRSNWTGGVLISLPTTARIICTAAGSASVSGYGECSIWFPVSRQRLRLGLHSPAGEEGYPGNLDVSADFTVESDDLHIRLEATTDAATPINLTYHPYFNLGVHARAFAGDHFLRVSAARFLPVVDSGLIPSGELCPVEGTPFDFRRSRPLGLPLADRHPQLALAGGYDHCFALDATSREVAELRSERSGITLQLHSDEPGLQFYGGQALSREHPGLAPGISLEPQAFPNAPNLPMFPSTILRPGQLYVNTIVYRFSRDPQNAP